MSATQRERPTIESLTLAHGQHTDRSNGLCLMEAVAWFADEPHSDHPECFPAGTVVSGPPVQGSTLRWYQGEMVELTLASGQLLTTTPNHPILTANGWVRAGEIDEGRDVICGTARDGVAGLIPDEYQRPALIEDVAAAVGVAGGGATRTVPVAPQDFHGDGIGSEVAVVRTDRLLRNRSYASVGQPSGKHDLVRGNPVASHFAGRGDKTLLLERPRSATARGVRCRRDRSTLFGGASTGDDSLNHAQGPSLGSGRFQGSDDDLAGYSVPDRQGILGFTGSVTTQEVVRVRRFPFAGHVFNLETVTGWYVANGVIVHNCVCPVLSAMGRGLNDCMPDDERQQLKPLIPLLIGTAGNESVRTRRANMAVDWIVRTYTPAWLDLAGLTERAAELRALPELDGTAAFRSAQPTIDKVRTESAAAMAAAWDAARAAAMDAAMDAAMAAAWAAAWAAARDAARAAARAAAMAAARDAAWDAAWAAARDAAWDAAWAAASKKKNLLDTSKELRASALDLFRRMIETK